MYKKCLILFISICMLFSLTSCMNNSSKDSSSGKIKVVVSFNAMKEFAYAIGKDKINIINMTPNGTEPHDFEPKTRDIEALVDADIFIYNGLGMESWTSKTLKSINNKNLIVVEASNGANIIKNTDAGEIKEHGAYDPHLWISLKGAELEAKNIKNSFVKADSKNKSFYEKNYNTFKNQLDELYSTYNEKFKTTENKNFVTGHAAFAYLCKDFGLKQESVEDVFAEGEPSTKRLSELTDFCKKNKVKTIFVEDMVSPKVSKTLAKEVGAKVEKIYTVESKEDGKNYIEAMKSNLEMIYNSLK
ncbi:metal ABC transporter substrate-binding protein [Clostridium guangxiense]|uniref:metal ABC transporter substrate-binding protein n=1 Tax=Clostridium guangxiense TaxID=1662055 RepID=UPI001E422241|nr:metal ABC transporter substrate-binding protein [Clostridium guangxiense]MCD2345736.1 metal ABC transporter substrate-binding protein [Clostridium guangxiense]